MRVGVQKIAKMTIPARLMRLKVLFWRLRVGLFDLNCARIASCDWS